MYSKAYRRWHHVKDKTLKKKRQNLRNPVILARLSALCEEFEHGLHKSAENDQKLQVFNEFHLSFFNNFDAAESLWRQFEKDAACFIYQRFSFCRSWYTSVGKRANKTPHIVAIQDLTGETVMLVPLCLEKTRFGTVVSFAGDGMADYLAPLVQDDFAQNITKAEFQKLWNSILATIDGTIDMVWLDRQPISIAGVRNPVSLLSSFDFVSSSHALKFPRAANWSQCARILRSGQTTKKIARRFAKLAGQGEIELVEITGAKARQDHIHKLLVLKVENLNQSGILHRMDKPDVARFYGALVGEETMQDDLCQFELRCGGKMIASVLGFVHHGTFYYQISAFNKKDFGRYSPGLLLQYQLLEWSFSRGLERFDMTVGDEVYKGDWSNETTTMVTVAQVFSTAGRLNYTYRRAMLWTTSKIKKSPRLRKLVMRVMKKADNIVTMPRFELHGMARFQKNLKEHSQGH